MERAGGDGQLVLLLSYLKKRFPERYKNVLIDGGDFHAFAHMMFGNHERFFDVCGSCFCDEARSNTYSNARGAAYGRRPARLPTMHTTTTTLCASSP